MADGVGRAQSNGRKWTKRIVKTVATATAAVAAFSFFKGAKAVFPAGAEGALTGQEIGRMASAGGKAVLAQFKALPQGVKNLPQRVQAVPQQVQDLMARLRSSPSSP